MVCFICCAACGGMPGMSMSRTDTLVCHLPGSNSASDPADWRTFSATSPTEAFLTLTSGPLSHAESGTTQAIRMKAGLIVLSPVSAPDVHQLRRVRKRVDRAMDEDDQQQAARACPQQ